MYLTLTRSVATEVEKRMSRRLQVGSLVGWNGRLHFVRGFDPMGASVPRAYLQDAETGEQRRILLDDLLDPSDTASAA